MCFCIDHVPYTLFGPPKLRLPDPWLLEYASQASIRASSSALWQVQNTWTAHDEPHLNTYSSTTPLSRLSLNLLIRRQNGLRTLPRPSSRDPPELLSTTPDEFTKTVSAHIPRPHAKHRHRCCHVPSITKLPSTGLPWEPYPTARGTGTSGVECGAWSLRRRKGRCGYV